VVRQHQLLERSFGKKKNNHINMPRKKIGNLYRDEEVQALEEAAARVRGLKPNQTAKDALNEYFMERAEKLYLACQKKLNQPNIKSLKDIPDAVIEQPAEEGGE
jgi:hypothetical protein